MLKINNVFSIEDRVYIVVDPDQNPYLITGIVIMPGVLMYKISGADGEDDYYDFELSKEKQVF